MRDLNLLRFKSDIFAGLNVAMLAIPQGMAYALIAGIPVFYGVIGSGFASLLGGIFGGKRFITLGPTNATAVLLFGMFASLGMIDGRGQISEQGLILIPCLLFLTGGVLILAGILGVSFFVKFISRTVITAYITAASLLIIVNQLKNALGIEIVSTEPVTNLLGSLEFLVLNFNQCSFHEITISLFTGFLFLSLKKVFPFLPNVAISLVLSSLLAATLNHYGLELTLLEPYSKNTDIFLIPNLEKFYSNMPILMETACALALLIVIEGLAIGRSLSSKCGERIDSKRETLSFGISNIICSFSASMPCSGSLTRSSLNINSGAMTKASNIFSGIIMILLFIALSNYIEFISLASLSTLVIFIGCSLIKARNLKTVIKATRSDCITFLVTFAIATLFTLQTSIFVGVFVSILFFLKKVAVPEMIEQGYNEKGELTDYSEKTMKLIPEVSIVHVEGELFFAAADLFYEQIRRSYDNPNVKVIILKLLNAHHLDATSVMALEELIESFKKTNCHVLICGIRKDILKVFKDSGLLSRMNRQNLFPHSYNNPTLSTANAVKHAKELLKKECFQKMPARS
jgi:SulP family sulfate permease